jgi:hypothetical protein
MTTKSILGFAAAGIMATSAAVMAAVTFDPATGSGFVGKGDVQVVYGWNNKGLQDNAGSVQFRVEATTVTEYAWICEKDHKNEQTQERSRTVTTTQQGVINSVARDRRNQVTGFILDGFSGGSGASSTTVEGPALNSCPNENGDWFLAQAADPDGEIVSQTGGGLEVSVDGGTWLALQ